MQSLLQNSPRDSDNITETAKQQLYCVKALRELVTVSVRTADFATNLDKANDLLLAYKGLGGAVSGMIAIGRDVPVDVATAVKSATSAIVVALRSLLDVVPRALHSLTKEEIAALAVPSVPSNTRSRRSQSLPQAVQQSPTPDAAPQATRALAHTGDSASLASPRRETVAGNPVSPRPMTLERVSRLLDQEMIAAERASREWSEPPAPTKNAPRKSRPSTPPRKPTTTAAASAKAATLPTGYEPTLPASTKQRDPRLVLMEKKLAAARAEAERQSMYAKQNSELLDSTQSQLTEKERELANVKREFSAFKRVSTKPLAAGSVEMMQAIAEGEAAKEELVRIKQNRARVIEMIDAELLAQHEELQALREFVLEAPFNGWMALKDAGILSRGWKDRFFVLHQGVLCCYANEDDDKPSALIQIADASVQDCKKTTREFAFQVRSPQRTLFIAADSINQRDAWITKINQVIAMYNEIDKKRSATKLQPTFERIVRSLEVEQMKLKTLKKV